jgi:hypothetical protein
MVKVHLFSFQVNSQCFSTLVPGFCKQHGVKRLNLSILALFLVFGLTAQAQNSSESLSNRTKAAKIRSAVNKTGTLKKKEKEVISKNLTPQEQQQLSSRKWSFIFGNSAFRSRDELSDYSGTLRGSLAYKLNSKVLLTSGLAYEYLVYKQGGSFLINEDDPRQFGIGDLRFGFSIPRSINLPKYKSFINFSGNIFLPTSNNSQDAGQYYLMNLTASMISIITPKFLVNSFASINHGSHQFEEANATGTALNSPLGFAFGGSLSYNLVKGLTTFTGYNISQRYEYSNGFRNIQSFSAGMQYAINSKTYLSGSFFWQDQFVTNDVVFDDDKSFYSISLDYIL